LVVGVDGSDDSLHALDAAVTIARRGGHPMVVVYVMHVPSLSAVGEATTPSGLAAVEAALEQTETHVRAEVSDRLSGIGLGWSFEPASGDPAAELIRVAAARHADAIVVGGKSHGVLGRLLLGSVAAKLVRRSPISVVVVRDGEERSFPGRVRDTAGPQARPAGLDRREALEEISVRLRIISGSLGDAHISTDELCEDVEELGEVARRIERLAGSCREVP
jgi:nucleotide-binding universal stress UspA family protein